MTHRSAWVIFEDLVLVTEDGHEAADPVPVRPQPSQRMTAR
jgi:hypothetical protein